MASPFFYCSKTYFSTYMKIWSRLQKLFLMEMQISEIGMRKPTRRWRAGCVLSADGASRGVSCIANSPPHLHQLFAVAAHEHAMLYATLDKAQPLTV